MLYLWVQGASSGTAMTQPAPHGEALVSKHCESKQATSMVLVSRTKHFIASDLHMGDREVARSFN